MREKPFMTRPDGSKIYGAPGPTEETLKNLKEQQARDFQLAKDTRGVEKLKPPVRVEASTQAEEEKIEKKKNVVDFPTPGSREKKDAA